MTDRPSAFDRACGRLARWLVTCYPPALTPHAADMRLFVADAVDDARASGHRRVLGVVAMVARDVVRARWRGGRFDLSTPANARSARRHNQTLRSRLMEQFIDDVRYALRRLAKTPSFTVSALLTLALAIGATTAVFTVVDVSMLRPLPYPDASRMVVLGEQNARGQYMSVAWPTYQDWATMNTSFSELGVFRGLAVNLTGVDRAERLNGAFLSASVFATTGIGPLAGQVFTAANDATSTPRVAVVSERLWRGRFASRPDLIGSTLVLNDQPHTVIGIMPASMRYPSRLNDVWLPLGEFVPTFPDNRGAHPGLTAVGRLKPGVTFDAARGEMDTIAQRLAQQYPQSNVGVGVSFSPYLDQVFSNIRPAYQLLLGAVVMVLLIGCANLASLMLAQSEARQRDMAVRAALGAGRWRLARQMLTEAVVLSVGGGLVGVGLAIWAVKAFLATNPSIVPRVDLITVDGRVLLVAAGVSVLTGLLFGVAPALRGSAVALNGIIKDGARQTGRGVTRLRSALVIGEVALALILLVGAGLFAKSFAKIMSTDLGFQPSHVITMRLTATPSKFPTLEAWTAFHRQLIDRISAAPGVERAGLNSALPLEGGGSEAFVIKEGDPMPTPTSQPASSSFQMASPGYLDAMGIQLIEGRFVTDRDTATSPRVVVVDDVLARKFFPNESAIGKRIAFEGSGHDMATFKPTFREVVGVVNHVTHYGLTGEPPHLQLFVAYTQLPTYNEARRPTMAIAVRTAGDPDAVLATIRTAVSEVDPNVPVYGMQTMTTYVNQASEQPRLSMTMLSGFAVLALLLAVIGVSGVLSYAVSLRTREIGVRMALGARPGEITGLIARQAALIVGAGLAIGVAGALGLSKLAATQLYQVSPTDKTTFIVVVAVLAVAAGFAAIVPARRAAKVDPLVALRSE